LAGNGEIMIQFELLVGEFSIFRFDDNSLWISRAGGEAMGEGLVISEEKFAVLIEQYYQENM